jgi:hypothetical protein
MIGLGLMGTAVASTDVIGVGSTGTGLAGTTLENMT